MSITLNQDIPRASLWLSPGLDKSNWLVEVCKRIFHACSQRVAVFPKHKMYGALYSIVYDICFVSLFTFR